MSSGPIATVDLSSFPSSGTQILRVEASKALYEAYHKSGFANVTGHGVPDALLQQAFEWTQKLFALPLSGKMKAPQLPTPVPPRGYSGVAAEKVYSKDELNENGQKGGGSGEHRKIEDNKVGLLGVFMLLAFPPVMKHFIGESLMT